MSTGRREATKALREKRDAGAFVPLSSAFLRSLVCKRLSAHASKLLLEFFSQYNGNNNGDLCAAWTLLSKRGWKSRDTLRRALRELLDASLIEVARQGGRHKATLYALTLFAVDECKGKLDIAPTRSPRGGWRKNEPAPSLAAAKVVTRPSCQFRAN